MLFQGFNNNIIVPNMNEELGKLKGFLTEEEGRVALVKYLRYNPGVTVEWLTGKELLPFQRLMIRSMFVKDFFLAVCSRGLSKSWTAAVFCFLFALFQPGSRIGILSKTFRQSQIVFRNIEDFANSPEGILLRQCLVKEPSHKNEIWRMELGSSHIVCLPLGEAGKLRGFRFNVVVIDELLLLPKDVIENVILPFLTVNFDPVKQAKTEKQEDFLIGRGFMKEEERTVFPNPKFIGLSSASYHFEYLYELYKSYVKRIYNVDDKESKHYGVMQFAYQVAENTKLYNINFVKDMKTRMSEQAFNREFGSVFTDDSGGYFSKKKMEECTIKPKNEPTIEIEGDSKRKYILAIDPSWSKSEASDHFAMSVLKLNEENRTATLVHNYAVAGGQMQDHMIYLRYILTHFNIVFVIIDHAGRWFIEDANLSTIFAEARLKLDFIDTDFMDEDYAVALHKAKNSYNSTSNKIAYAQYFSPPWIRRANEMLAASFDHRKIFFASPAMNEKFDRMKVSKIPVDSLKYNPKKEELEGRARLADFIEHQVYLIDETKNEIALIQLTSESDSSVHKFRLPVNVRKSDSPNKPRRDNYTSLLLGNWAMKCYFDMIYAPPPQNDSFVPFFVR